MQRQAIRRCRRSGTRCGAAWCDVPERLVEAACLRRARAAISGPSGLESEDEGEPAVALPPERDLDERGDRQQLADEDEALELVARVSREEVPEIRRVAHLFERASAGPGSCHESRPGTRRSRDDRRRRANESGARLQAGPRRTRGRTPSSRARGAGPGPTAWHGRDRGDRQPARAPRLERPEREREEQRDRAEQMAAGRRLDRAVRRQREEREPADERAAREAERPSHAARRCPRRGMSAARTRSTRRRSRTGSAAARRRVRTATRRS